ncbi:hypothetical protein [Streptomyces indicus]|uniref:Uncharacterized protein n=1 Tax=Streptomyces indicus TaxID=417292 RepID=A0A1G9IT75_9ACTN|nr:hypothetical protein [Streptomyces indicus]SDL28256.1 hypothetical protein SAMN05421806_12550 [Streptomyces indicus]
MTHRHIALHTHQKEKHMPINDEDDVTPAEAARIVWLAARKEFRESRGKSGARFERKIDRLLDRAAVREDEKRAIRAEVEQAKRAAEYAKKRDKAVERATRKTSWW